MSALPAAVVTPPAQSTVNARPCVLINPRSFQASTNDLANKALTLARRHGCDAVQVHDRAQLLAELQRLQQARCERLFILAGDGTVHGVVQYLSLLPNQAWHPELLVLGGGRSNVTASEFGHGSALHKLDEALRRVRDGKPFTVQERQALRVEQDGRTPQHGFLLAGGFVDAAIRLCERHRHAGTSWLHTGVLSSQYCLAKLGLQVLRGRSPLPPDPQLRIDLGTAGTVSGAYRLLMATTLQHRGSLVNPYAVRGAGPVRLTAIAPDAKRFWRRVPRVLTGHFTSDMTAEHGFVSGRFERVALTGLTSFCLDGEMFEPDQQQPLILQGGPVMRMLQL